MEAQRHYSVQASISYDRTIVRSGQSVQAASKEEAEQIARADFTRQGYRVHSIEVFEGGAPASFWHR